MAKQKYDHCFYLINIMNVQDIEHDGKLKDVNTIAIFRALQLGDMLCMIPAVRALKRAYPNATITLISLPWQEQFAQRFSKYFSAFIAFPGWPGLPEKKYDVQEVVQFLQHVQKQNFDLVIQMQGGGNIANPLCMLFGGKYFAGLRKVGDTFVSEELSPFLREDEHEIKRFLKLVEAVGAVSQGGELEFEWIDEELKNFHTIRETLALEQPYICLHAGARDPRRRWAPVNFAFIGDQLAQRGFTILLTGSGEEKELLDQVAGLMQHPVKNLVAQVGHVGVGELAAIIANARALISNDTGVSHIASATRTPSVVIFSPFSDSNRWAPLNQKINVSIFPDQAKDPERVLYSVLDLLEENQTRLNELSANLNTVEFK